MAHSPVDVVDELSTPAAIIDADTFEANLTAMSAVHPGARLRPHVKAYKTTAIAARQAVAGHHAFTVATPREALGLAAAGLGDDILIANEVVDPRRLAAVAALGADEDRNRQRADVGLKALGMDHGNPTMVGGDVWYFSDEHITFTPADGAAVGNRIRVVPAHIDPTMAVHEAAWLVRSDEVLERWAIDLRGWD